MRKSFVILLVSMMISCMMIGCNQEGTSLSDTPFSIYTADVDSYDVPRIASYIEIVDQLPIEEKIQILCKEMSEKVFSNDIELIGIGTERGKKIATINLITKNDNHSPWYFAGTTGGSITYLTITETILQKDYDGEWIDGVLFLRDNKVIYDDIAPLSSIIYRNSIE